MRYLTYNQDGHYPLVFLVPAIFKQELEQAYIEPFGIDKEKVLVLDLHNSPGKKATPVREIKEYIEEELYPAILDAKAEYIVCADSGYYKVLAKVGKADANLGYVTDSIIDGVKIIYVPNYRAIFYDPPKVKAKIALSMNALQNHRSGCYMDPGSDIIKHAEYPQSVEAIAAALDKLLAMNCPLTVDIEAFDLKHHKSGIGTIAFAWNQGEGIAFAVDYQPIHDATEAPYGKQVRNEPVRALLRDFFEKFMETAIYHNAAFDMYILVYQLFMTDLIDTEGMLNGFDVMMRNWDCTKLITYLATNSCAGNKLGLKDQAQEFAGNYAESEIKDITRIPLPQLLRYNLVDTLSTWFVHTKHWSTMVHDQQEDIYETLFKKASKDIIQMQLTGMPLHMPTVLKVESALQGVFDDAITRIEQTKCVQQYQYTLKEKYIEKMHAKWKKKRITLAEVPEEEKFNPRSPLQLQGLLYDQLGLPVLALTDTKQPSCDGDTIGKLLHHTKDPDVLDLLRALQDFAAVDKILGSFIPAFKEAAQGPDGWWYLFGNFVLGGTVSGRLSSNSPNLQNLPANVMMKVSDELLERFPLLKDFMKKGMLSLGKLIKFCFQAPPGWIFAGLDFASLEDRISALTTKDPMKLKVYTDGYDGHCLRAYSYFGDQMEGIDPESVESINSIESKYKDLRQESKAPTFALTYQGTYITLMKNCGFSEEKAKMVEAKYHEMYRVSTEWVQAKLNQAAKDGYVTTAFGLRVRTPLLAQVIRGNSKTPYEAEAEGRTAGNALGQGWCLLNSRAWVEFMEKVRDSDQRLNIRPCAQIHDAGYALIRDDMDTVLYMNEHLVNAVNWNDHPDIYHPDVGLGGNLSLFYPTWATEIEIENGATAEEITSTIQEAFA
ncbi:putative DNA polymerase I [Achromobacter phage vB_AxyP_19-32_Axy04]|uniref:Putative DNA polymerase I n=1 Tax=Achromobacter phage vB_AxyP_19-32_Axy04 TaxID=2591039 RepID=A0A514CTD3_9CAUD|nr:DNA polymerase [Achromobacter phage vB_AxyP_19-32_Axy04]QDH83732.1 putative DNA polymerase I [Achromobacter phage vB_AxyP_19-32_Axy04]